MRRAFSILAILIVAFFAGYIYSNYNSIFNPKAVVEEESSVLLEKIQTVAKLVTVEGQFSDIYSYKDYTYYDLPFLRKKILLKVRAKVSVGYDMEKVKFESRPDERVLIISNLPKPEILSVEPEINYYDMYEGVMNSFDEKELTELNKKAIQFIRNKAEMSDELMSKAEDQGMEIFKLIEFIVKDAGWEVRYESATPTIGNSEDSTKTIKD